MKSLILLAPLLGAGAWYAGAFATAPALSEEQRRVRCAELEELFLADGVVSQRLGADTSAGEATAMIRRAQELHAEMRRHDCEQFDAEKRDRARADRAARRQQERGREWGEAASAAS